MRPGDVERCIVGDHPARALWESVARLDPVRRARSRDCANTIRLTNGRWADLPHSIPSHVLRDYAGALDPPESAFGILRLTEPARDASRGAVCLCGRRDPNAETYVSTEQPPPGQDAWIPGADEDQGRPGGAGAPASQGPLEADRQRRESGTLFQLSRARPPRPAERFPSPGVCGRPRNSSAC